MSAPMIRITVRSSCPSCGRYEKRETYDIGDGPELSCSNCEWCWGANGQPLTQSPIEGLQKVVAQIRPRWFEDKLIDGQR